jgi:hypothetical protein
MRCVPQRSEDPMGTVQAPPPVLSPRSSPVTWLIGDGGAGRGHSLTPRTTSSRTLSALTGAGRPPARTGTPRAEVSQGSPPGGSAHEVTVRAELASQVTSDRCRS